MQHPLKIQSIAHVTHDVLGIRTERPGDVEFVPGQAADISINKDKWKEEIRPFTFTSLPENNFLEFTIKTYPTHHGVTNELLSLKPNDELLIHGVFGAIAYKGEGTFIAGGAGITPFISIIRDLYAKKRIGNNKLIFANNTKADIIHKDDFNRLLGKNFINILAKEKVDGFAHGFISKDFLSQHIDLSGYIYLCGPPPMMDAVEKHLGDLKIPEERIVKEAF
jgi:ferredoxin-NADP reductase